MPWPRRRDQKASKRNSDYLETSNEDFKYGFDNCPREYLEYWYFDFKVIATKEVNGITKFFICSVIVEWGKLLVMGIEKGFANDNIPPITITQRWAYWNIINQWDKNECWSQMNFIPA